MKLFAVVAIGLVLALLVALLVIRLNTSRTPDPPRIIVTNSIPPVSLAADNRFGDGDSFSPSITADGRFVAFHSDATNLIGDDTNGIKDIFVHDRKTGQTTRVSVSSGGAQANKDSYPAFISADGRFVAFSSIADNLVAGDTNEDWDVFVHDRQTGQTMRISVASDGGQGRKASYDPSISADGRLASFYSFAENLTSGDTNAVADVFVHDRETEQTSLVSTDSRGALGDGISLNSNISADGRFVAFQSVASNLVDTDTNSQWDVFVHDLITGQTARVSVDSDGTEGNKGSFAPSISADGRYVAFYSEADNLDGRDIDDLVDVFVHDRRTGETTLVSATVNGNTYSPSISADGRYVALCSDLIRSFNDAPKNIGEVFACDVTGNEARCSSLASTRTVANADSNRPFISQDGRYVAFQSRASNMGAGDTNDKQDIFVYDRREGQATVRSVIPTSGDRLVARPYHTTLDFPANTFETTVVVTYTGYYPDRVAVSSNLIGIGRSFLLDVRGLESGKRVQPTQPYTIRVEYEDQPYNIELGLALFYRTEGQWIREPSSRLDRIANVVIAAPNHVSLWAVLGGDGRLFLPIILQSGRSQ